MTVLGSHVGSDARVALRSYVAADRKGITKVLSFIESLYPDGLQWLQKRLTDVEGGKAFCTVAIFREQFAGLLIDTPKGIRTRKISTFYVRDPFRHKGVATSLLAHHADEWRKAGIDRIYITAPTKGQDSLERFLAHHGFHLVSIAPEKYGEGRDEAIFEARTEQIWDSLR